MNTFKVGDNVLALGPNVGSFTPSGRPGVLIDIVSGAEHPYKIDFGDGLSFWCRTVVRNIVAPEAGPTVDEVTAVVGRDIVPDMINEMAEMREQHRVAIDALKEEQATRIVAQRENWTKINDQFRDSIQIISDALKEEATSRGWCSEYNDFVGEVNAKLPLFELEGATKKYCVTWAETVTVDVGCSMEVEAVDADSALEMARDGFDGINSSMIIDSVRGGNWESYDNDAENCDVEEV